mmetsp:Transcript_68975/g.121995  ORF Transcript_68975/g.121995 Transcript_68975/m.121995 type:complete len:274 (-) Transcript_68975:28-849(-)
MSASLGGSSSESYLLHASPTLNSPSPQALVHVGIQRRHGGVVEDSPLQPRPCARQLPADTGAAGRQGQRAAGMAGTSVAREQRAESPAAASSMAQLAVRQHDESTRLDHGRAQEGRATRGKGSRREGTPRGVEAGGATRLPPRPPLRRLPTCLKFESGARIQVWDDVSSSIHTEADSFKRTTRVDLARALRDHVQRQIELEAAQQQHWRELLTVFESVPDVFEGSSTAAPGNLFEVEHVDHGTSLMHAAPPPQSIKHSPSLQAKRRATAEYVL